MQGLTTESTVWFLKSFLSIFPAIIGVPIIPAKANIPNIYIISCKYSIMPFLSVDGVSLSMSLITSIIAL